jgi:hypothetical protein
MQLYHRNLTYEHRIKNSLSAELGIAGEDPDRNDPLDGAMALGNCRSARETELDAPQTRIDFALIQQLLVGAALDHLTLIHHINTVGIADRRKPVGDRDRRAVLGNGL